MIATPPAAAAQAPPIDIAIELHKLRQEVAALAEQVATLMTVCRSEVPHILATFAKAADSRIAAIDKMGGALQRTIERVEIIENTIRGADLHGGEPSPAGGAATMN